MNGMDGAEGDRDDDDDGSISARWDDGASGCDEEGEGCEDGVDEDCSGPSTPIGYCDYDDRSDGGEEAEAGHDDEDEAEDQLVDREDRAAEQVLRVQRDDEEEEDGAGVVKVVVALRRLLRGLDLRRVDGGGG